MIGLMRKIKKNQLTASEIQKITGCELWVVDYLSRIGALPVIRRGKGMPRLFSHRAIKIVEKYQAKHGGL